MEFEGYRESVTKNLKLFRKMLQKFIFDCFKFGYEVISTLGKGFLEIVKMYPKASVVVLGIIIFLYCLGNVQGFGEMVAQIIAIALVIWVIKLTLTPKRKTK